MMLAEDARECNRLERNAKRLEKIGKSLGIVYRENNVSDTDILFIIEKVAAAREKIVEVRRMLTSR